MSMYEKIQMLCKKEGFEISNLGEKIPGARATKGSISKWKSGAVPHASTLKAIADYFGVTPDYLLADGQPSADNKKAATDDDIKVALFGGDGEVTDEMWKEALDFVDYIKERNKRKKSDDKR